MTWGQGSSRAYRKARAQVLERDERRCQLRYSVCIGIASEVDHITNLATLGRNRTDVIDTNDWQAVCPPCHRIKTRIENGDTNPRWHPRRAVRPQQPHPGDL